MVDRLSPSTRVASEGFRDRSDRALCSSSIEVFQTPTRGVYIETGSFSRMRDRAMCKRLLSVRLRISASDMSATECAGLVADDTRLWT